MALHLIKLCVGAESIADLQAWIQSRRQAQSRRSRPCHADDAQTRRGIARWRLALLGHQGPALRASKAGRTGAFRRYRRDQALRPATGRRSGRRDAPPLPGFSGLALSQRPRTPPPTSEPPAPPKCRRPCGANYRNWGCFSRTNNAPEEAAQTTSKTHDGGCLEGRGIAGHDDSVETERRLNLLLHFVQRLGFVDQCRSRSEEVRFPPRSEYPRKYGRIAVRVRG